MNEEHKSLLEFIEGCRKAGISEFEHNGLRLRFSKAEKVEETIIGLPDPKLSKEQLEEMEFQVKQDQLERLRLEDPLAYEQAILEHEIQVEGA